MVLINRKKQTDEIRKCARDPVYFFNTYTKIQHPLRGPIHFKTFEFQEECAKDFIDNRFVIVNKARQLGLSTLTAAYVAWLALFHRGKEILIIATKLTTAQNFIKKVKFVIKNLPPWLVLPSITGDNKTTIEFGKPSNSRVQAVPTSPDAGRSEALSLLVVDEAAHIRDMEELWKGLYPTLSTGGRAILLSTPKGQGNQFHKLCSEAQAGTNEFKYIELPWHVHPERDQEWFDKETKNMERQGIAQELLCDFLASGDTYLHIDEINWVQERVREPIRREGEGRNLWIWFDPISGPDVKYIISADVASGTGRDYSAFHCINTTTGQVVAEYKGKIRPDLFATLIHKYAVRYNNALVCVERNSYGQHTNTHLITQHNYTHVYFPKQSIPLGSYIPQESIGQAGFDTSPQNRPKVLAKMEEVLRNKQIEVFSSRLYDELKSFVMLNNKPQASRNCHDDLVMSLAIGLWLFDVSGVHSQFAVQLNKSMINAFGSSRNDFENMAGNGREVLPSWSSMVPYMGEQSGGSRSGRQRPKGDDPGNFDWLLWK